MQQNSNSESAESGSNRHVVIHHFYTLGGVDTYDSEGEVLLGHYWQVMDDAITPACEPFGPYGDFEDAEAGGRQALETGAY